MSNQTLTAPKGFRAAAVQAGIKTSGRLDLGLIAAQCPCSAAAAFTTNKIVAAAVVIDKERIRAGRARAIFINAGNANACTGKRGARDVHTISLEVARHLDIKPDEVLVCSTGIIGQFLPMDKVRAGISRAAAGLSGSAQAAKDLARAILTTDLKTKTAYEKFILHGKQVQIAGIAKGSGMIAPHLATLLAFITTDAAISPAMLRRALRQSVAQTFNKVNVDNHMSTSDTVIVLASGLANHKRIVKTGRDYERFARALGKICDSLAYQVAADGEGATCTVTVKVKGAAGPGDARRALRAIVDSPLVRCAFNGADPNWGRIISAVGYSRARFDPEALSCKIAGVRVFHRGRPCRFDPAQLSRRMKDKQWQVEVHLGAGKYADFCYTCDLSKAYVSINADYHT